METGLRKGRLAVQPGVDLAGDLFRQPRHSLELLEGGGQKGLRGAEVFEDLLFTRRADAGQLIQDGAGHLRAPKLAVVGVGEAVGLVPDALEEMQLRGVALENGRIGAARLEDLLLALGEPTYGYVRQLCADSQLLHDRNRRRKLALAAVHHDQVWGPGELLVTFLKALEPSPDHLGHAREVVRTFNGLDLEPTVLILGRPPSLEHHHRGDRVRPHRVVDVVALYP